METTKYQNSLLIITYQNVRAFISIRQKFYVQGWRTPAEAARAGLEAAAATAPPLSFLEFRLPMDSV